MAIDTGGSYSEPHHSLSAVDCIRLTVIYLNAVYSASEISSSVSSIAREQLQYNIRIVIMSVYDQLPTNVSLEIAKFLVALPEEDLQDLKNLVRSAKLGPKTYENMRSDGNFGLTYEWMSNAKAHWENQFNW